MCMYILTRLIGRCKLEREASARINNREIEVVNIGQNTSIALKKRIDTIQYKCI